jgi:hypothetical protein
LNPERFQTLCASLHSRNAVQNFTTATLYGNLQETCRAPEWAPWSSTGLYTYRRNPSVWTRCLGNKQTTIMKNVHSYMQLLELFDFCLSRVDAICCVIPFRAHKPAPSRGVTLKNIWTFNLLRDCVDTSGTSCRRSRMHLQISADPL